MKKVFLFMGAAVLLLAQGCGNGKSDGQTDAGVPQGMVAADLSEFGMNLLMNVPDSTYGKLEMTANALGGADVKVGKNFQVSVVMGEGNMEMKKNDIASDEVRKLVKYIVDEPGTLVWEWQMEGGEPEFHFYTIVRAGDESYEVFSVAGEVFSEKAVMDMLDAAKSLRPKSMPAKEDS